jgi:hypothetical protein
MTPGTVLKAAIYLVEAGGYLSEKGGEDLKPRTQGKI